MEALRDTLQERLAALFERCPILAGFSVQTDDCRLGRHRIAGRLDEELCLADVTVEAAPDSAAACALADEIAAELHALIEEQPEEARALLRGRTFTRTLH